MASNKKSVLVALIGPDGSGKSTVARGLEARAGLAFCSKAVHRWTLGALPPLSPLVDAIDRLRPSRRRAPSGSVEAAGPDKATHSGMFKPLPAWQSALIVGYHALDLALSRLTLWRRRSWGELRVMDRSFLDFFVVPGHAALPRWFLQACWAITAKPDLLLVIEREPADIYRDKPELTQAEIRRQQAAVASLPPGCGRTLHLDGRWGAQVMVEQAAAAIDSLRLNGSFEGPLTMFLRRAQDAPQALAIEDGAVHWTYGQLRAYAEGVARSLGQAGARRGDVVALQGRRGRELCAALLGTWMAGGVALMLDERHPPARRRQMCATAAVRWLVRLPRSREEPIAPDAADEAAALGLPEHAEVRLRDHPVAGDDSTPESWRPLHGQGPAYVMFTSGTTGVPKGVVGGHEALGHFLAWQRDRFQVQPGDRVAHLTHVAFDVVLREVLVPLVSGATLVVPDSDDEWPDRVMPWMQEKGITLLHAVPSLAQQWLASTPPLRRGVASLRWTLFAGEPLTDSLVLAWQQAHPQVRIANLYGPTETTLAKFCAEVSYPPAPGVQAVGHPLPDCRAWVLNDAGRPCAPGEPGEILLATPHRALALIGEGGQDKSFGVNPVTGDPLDLVYRTGDRGCWNADGSLQVLGRIDGQVKVRGVRVEPAEVERAMLRLPQVRQALVGALPDAQGQLELVACVVMDGPGDLGALQQTLREHLPQALRPSHIRCVTSLPLTERGKLDRRALGRWFENAKAQAGPQWPETAQARRLRQAWIEILGHDGFGPNDDFFAVGGDSLKALMLALRMAKWTGRAPLARWAYDQPTANDQLNWWDAVLQGQIGQGTMQPMIFGSGRPHRVIGLPPLLGYGLVYHRLARNLPEHEILAFDFPEHGDPIEAYLQALSGELRPLVLLGYSAGGNLAFELARRWEAQGGMVQRIVMLDSNRWLTPEQLADDEIERIIAGNLAHLQSLFDADEHFARYAAEQDGQLAMAQRMRAFLRYEREHLNTGSVQADLIYIQSEQFPACTQWASATRGAWTLTQGHGQHLQMLHGATADLNAAVIGPALRGEAAPLSASARVESA